MEPLSDHLPRPADMAILTDEENRRWRLARLESPASLSDTRTTLLQRQEHALAQVARLEQETVPPPSLGSWRVQLHQVRTALADLDTRQALAAERDDVARTLGRPAGCWCLGLGGCGIPWRADDGTLIWQQWCICPEAQHGQALQAQFDADWDAVQTAERLADEAARRSECWATAGVPTGMREWTLGSYPATRVRLLDTLRAAANPERYPLERGDDSRLARRGRGLYLHGRAGRGKTGLAVATLRAWIEQGGGGFFCVPVEYLATLRASFNGDDSDRAAAVRLRDQVYHAGLLVLDDLGAEKPSPWVREQLYALLNYRINERLPMLCTSNWSIEDAVARLCAGEDPRVAERLESRLAGLCDSYELQGGDDLRTRRAVS